jgi:hypothetical protein
MVSEQLHGEYLTAEIKSLVYQLEQTQHRINGYAKASDGFLAERLVKRLQVALVCLRSALRDMRHIRKLRAEE